MKVISFIERHQSEVINNNNLWIATSYRGIGRYDGNECVTIENTDYTWYRWITKDHSGNIWFGNEMSIEKIVLISSEPEAESEDDTQGCGSGFLLSVVQVAVCY